MGIVGRLGSLLDRMRQERDALVRRAARKAADAALARTKDAAKGALDTVSDTIERAVFGDVLSTSNADPDAPPDPFAKLKAREREAREGDDVDAELAALRNRLKR